MSYIEFFMNLNSESKNTSFSKFEYGRAIQGLKLDVTHWKQKDIMATSQNNDVSICKMSLKGVKLKWEKFILLSCGILELLGKVLKEGCPRKLCAFLVRMSIPSEVHHHSR